MRGFLTLALALAACGDPALGTGEVTLAPLFAPAPAQAIPGCVHGSLVADDAAGIIASAADGVVYALDPTTGAVRWTVRLPAPPGEAAFAVATPLRLDRRLVVAYHTIAAKAALPDVTDARLRHRVAVVDLDRGALDDTFTVFDLDATGKSVDGLTVPFSAANSLARSALVRLRGPGPLGRVAITFGNSRDIQPWHGWVIAVDLDGWAAGAPTTQTFLATPELACGTPGESGSTDRICGGGIWSPGGPLVLAGADGRDALIVATGNGAFDLARRDYANALLRLDPDLAFSPGCDPTACAGQSTTLADACAASCVDLFYPRLAGAPVPRPASGICDGLDLFDCWAALDWDFGGGTPALVTLPGRQLLVHPAKDGAVYLVDAAHLGTLYDRHEIAAPCGADGDVCTAGWAGMMVAQPTIVDDGGLVTALVATFEFDRTHPAGLHALDVIEEGGAPRLRPRWRAPKGDADARRRFRRHPSNVAVMNGPRGPIAWVVEPTLDGSPARALGVDVRSGRVVADHALAGGGMRFQRPLVLGDRLYVASCESDRGPARVEGYLAR